MAAAFRAAHYLYDEPKVFEDSYALALTSPHWRMVCRSRLLHWFVLRRFLGDLRPVHGQILARSRLAEEALGRAIGSGVTQYVIVGAGLDSFALRRPDLMARLRIFEVDHPATQAAKRSRVRELVGQDPAHLQYVPVDFERETVADGLRRSGFDPSRPAFVSWLGVVYYLTRDAVFGTLRAIREIAAPGSELVLDFTVPLDQVPAEDLRVSAAMRRFAAHRGEPFLTRLDPALFPGEAEALGYRVLELVGSPEQQRRFFAGRQDGLRTVGTSHFLRLGVEG